MNEKGFKAFLKEGKRVPKDLKDDVIHDNIEIVKRFEAFIRRDSPQKEFKNASGGDVKRFVKHLAAGDENTFQNLIGLLRYSRFIDNREVELETTVTLDGGDVLGRLLEVAKAEIGKRRYDEIFAGFVPPPLGTSPKDLPRITNEFMRRLQKGTGRKTSKAVLLIGVHAGPLEAYADEKEMFRASKDVDEYLSRRRQRLIDVLEGHMKNGTLFHTQEIDKPCLDFVRDDPEVAGGVRIGDCIYRTKIPYMMKEYLKEKDPTLRRYYYCHCPLARESIMSGETLPRDFCYCSAGYEKKPYEVAFGRPVKTAVLKSVLWGDDVCRFRMEIPEEYRGGRKKKRSPKRTQGRKPRGKKVSRRK